VLPTGIGTIQNFVLFSPYYTAAGIRHHGTTTLISISMVPTSRQGHQLRRVQRALSVPGLDIHETMAGIQDGSFGTGPWLRCSPASTTLDIVEEDYFGAAAPAH